ncbi:MAG: SPOR domain-containing protein [Bacteroidales bacterium]|nr:SPOR domain-containing protein [Bacteroidales bacterium]
MDVVKYISDLLYSHNCVVVPDLGGFIGSFAPAKVFAKTHTFYPPSKNILFNSSLKQDDGLLTHHISISNNIEYSEAASKVRDFVIICKQELSNRNKVQLKNIGELIRRENGVIEFEPDLNTNYLSDSFGMDAVVSPIIERRRHQKIIEQKFFDRKPVSVSGRRKKVVYWGSVAVLPVLILGLWLIFDFGKMNNSSSYSSLGPETTLSEDITTNQDQDGIIADNKVTPEDIKAKNIKDLPLNPEQKIDEPDPPVKVPEKRYFIIIGAFKIKNNAEKLVTKLIGEGNDARIVDKTPAGLNLVSKAGFVSKNEAVAELNTLRQNKNSSAWIYKK